MERRLFQVNSKLMDHQFEPQSVSFFNCQKIANLMIKKFSKIEPKDPFPSLRHSGQYLPDSGITDL